MGVSYSNSLQHLQTEMDTKFLRPLELSVQSQAQLANRPFEERARKVLFTYPSLLLIRFLDGMSIDLGHLAVLFVLDADKDGLFSWRDIESFVEWVHNTLPEDEKEHGSEFSEAVHARCVLQMWRDCTGLGGATDEEENQQNEAGLDNRDINLSGPHKTKRGSGYRTGSRPTYSEVPEVMSVASSPAHDVLSPDGRSNSIISLSTQSHQPSKQLGDESNREGGTGEGSAEDRELFEEWFELFLSKNFPFASDRVRQQAPTAYSASNNANSSALVSSSSVSTPAQANVTSTATTGNGTKRSSATSSTHHHHVVSSTSVYNSLVVDSVGAGSISVAEVTPQALRLHPRAFSLDAIAAAHALLGVEENYGLGLKGFCGVLLGEDNLRAQGKNFACPSKALRAFNTAFVDSYWAALRRFGLQPLL